MHVLLRPNLDEFLRRVSLCFGEVIIFTASLAKYANMIIDLIDKDKVVKYRLFRENCTWINNIYVKELKRLNRNMRNVIIVDNNPNSFYLDCDNGIPIKGFYQDKNDKELLQMAYVLEKLSKIFDVRLIIKEIIFLNQLNYDKAFELFKHKEKSKATNDNESLIKGMIHNNQPNLIKNNRKKSDGNGYTQLKILNIEKIDSKGSLAKSPLKIESIQTSYNKAKSINPMNTVNNTKAPFYPIGNKKKVEMKVNNIVMSNINNKSHKTRKFFKSFNDTYNSKSKIDNIKKPHLQISGNTHVIRNSKEKPVIASDNAKGSNSNNFKYSCSPLKNQTSIPSSKAALKCKTPVNQVKESNTYTSLLCLNSKKATYSTPVTTTESIRNQSSATLTKVVKPFKSKKIEIKDVKTESLSIKTTSPPIKSKKAKWSTESLLVKNKKMRDIKLNTLMNEKSTRRPVTNYNNERIDTSNMLTPICSLRSSNKKNKSIRRFGKNQCNGKEDPIKPMSNLNSQTINSSVIRKKSKSELKIIQIIPTTSTKTLKRSKTTTAECTHLNNSNGKEE